MEKEKEDLIEICAKLFYHFVDILEARNCGRNCFYLSWDIVYYNNAGEHVEKFI